MRSRTDTGPRNHGFWFKTFFFLDIAGWDHWMIRRVTSTYVLIVRSNPDELGPRYVLIRWDDIDKED